MAVSAGISEDAFKKGMRELVAAVNIITVAHNGSQDGLTATAACSVSAEPPQLLICVNRDTGSHDLIQESCKFALNILARDQEDVAMRFAGMDDADRTERFDLGKWSIARWSLSVTIVCVQDSISSCLSKASRTSRRLTSMSNAC